MTTDLEPHAYRHATSDDGHEALADCPCYYCHRPMTEHADFLPDGAMPDDDLDALAAELATEYAAAVERVRDRAMEARYGGRLTRQLSTEPKYERMTREAIDAYARDLATEP